MRTSLLLTALLLSPPALCVSALCVPACAQDASSLASQLSNKDLAKREAAAQALAKLGPEAFPALEALLGATKDRAFKVRVASVEAVAAIGAKASEPAHKRLLELLKDKSAQVRAATAHALRRLGLAPKSLPQIAGLIGDQKWRVRAAAVEAIASTGDAAMPLLEELRYLSTGDASPSVRKLAAAALAALEKPESPAEPESPAKTDEPNYRGQTLTQLKAGLAKSEKDLHDAIRDIGRLGPLSAPLVSDLISLLGHAETWVRADTCKALGKIGSAAAPATEALTKLLKSDHEQLRRQAAKALGKIGPGAKAAVPALVEAWSAEDDRGAVAEALAGIGAEAAAARTLLAEAFPKSKGGTQAQIARALAAQGEAGAALLVAAAADEKLPIASRGGALEAAAGARGGEALVLAAAWGHLTSDDDDRHYLGHKGLAALALWSPTPLAKLDELAKLTKSAKSRAQAEILQMTLQTLEDAKAFHAKVSHDPASAAAIPALISLLEGEQHGEARGWLELQAARDTKVLDALRAHVGSKTEGRAYVLLCHLSGQEPAGPRPQKEGPTKKEGATEKEEIMEPAERAGVDLSHVKVGQVYVYSLDASGTKMEMRYVVEQVDETSVTYRTETVVAGNVSKTPATKWEFVEPKGGVEKAPAPDVKTRFEAYELEGESWEAMVVETNGTTTWIPYKGGSPTFPPLFKAESKAMKMKLVEVQQPKK